MEIQVVGVVGAGVMGSGVSQNLAQTGHQVILVDLSQEILEQAKATIQENVRLQCLLTKREKAPGPDEVLRQITCSPDYRLLSKVDFVIENVTEKWDIKRDVYLRLDGICPVQCIFASNTSAIPITRLASVTTRASKVIGLHFMNPVPLKPMVEMIRGFHTSDDTVKTTTQLLMQMGKKGIIVNDSPGFVSNRVLMVTINEAIYLLQEHVASAEDIDNIFRSCLGHPMGPLETADLIGLDTVLSSIKVLYESFHDSKYRPCPLLEKMVAAGLYGRKTGQGFYPYPIGR
jgi:3-hydroxybutyryl-CoA dehydrogenase